MKKRKILIVEDEKILAEMYREKLENSGFEVFSASNGEDGFDLAKEMKPDIILLDILLPRKNGLELLAQIREDSQIASMPVVVFSNYDDLKTIREAERLGIKDYLIKANYTPKEMLERLEKALE